VPPSLFQPTGNPAFDEAFSAAGGTPGTIECVLTPAVQRRIMAHDDWVFRAEGYLFACVRKGKFRDVEEIRHQVAEVMDVVRAIPESVRHRYIDRSADDLAARISRLENLDEATEFLRHLSRTDRENLAESNTPLAAFADVWTPEQAEARFQSLDPQRRWQLIAMFRRAEEERGQPGANGNGRR
jgi:hypothetical protein